MMEELKPYGLKEDKKEKGPNKGPSFLISQYYYGAVVVVVVDVVVVVVVVSTISAISTHSVPLKYSSLL
jgi:hypothetical protein